nr:PREDICTED: protein D3-like isoform X5 [Bemisia tabaci]
MSNIIGRSKMDRLEHPFEEWCYSLLFLLLTIAYFQENLAQKMSTPGPTWGPTVDPNSRVYSPIRSAEEIEESLRHHMLLPFIISYAPKQMLWMEFIDGFVADIGNDLSGRDVLYPPWLVKWPFKNDSYYAILGTGPDTLVNGLRIRKEFMHWLVVNIPGKHVAGGRAILHGETMADYIGPTPPEGRDYNRYAFFVYEQRVGKTKYGIPKLNATPTDPLRQFISEEFARKMHFGKATATNFFCV